MSEEEDDFDDILEEMDAEPEFDASMLNIKRLLESIPQYEKPNNKQLGDEFEKIITVVGKLSQYMFVIRTQIKELDEAISQMTGFAEMKKEADERAKTDKTKKEDHPMFT
jgi:wobble nucleotide-excising tRNase